MARKKKKVLDQDFVPLEGVYIVSYESRMNGKTVIKCTKDTDIIQKELGALSPIQEKRLGSNGLLETVFDVDKKVFRCFRRKNLIEIKEA
jgi:hypothetical protein